MSDFWTRLRTAIFFVAIMIGSIFWNQYSYAVLTSIIILFSLLEYYNLVRYTREVNKVSKLYKTYGIVVGLLFHATSLLVITQGIGFGWYFVCVALLFGFFALELQAESSNPMTNVAQNITGVVYIALPFVMLNNIAFIYDYYEPKLILGILFLVWINDAWAYLFGSLFGKHKFLERISPNKTWEGLAGGFLGGAIVAYLEYLIFGIFTFPQWLGIALLACLGGIIGDLVVSLFKRSLSIKDTGEFFPGHGGFLDRFDAFLFAIPIVAPYIFLIR